MCINYLWAVFETQMLFLSKLQSAGHKNVCKCGLIWFTNQGRTHKFIKK